MQKATSGKEVAFIYTGKFIKTVRKFIKSIHYFENHFSFALKWFSFLTQKLMFQVDGKIAGTMTRSGGFMGGFSLSVQDKFDIFRSYDKKNILVQYRKKPEVKNDKKSFDIIGLAAFDNMLNEISNREVTMPYTERRMNNLDYQLDNDGNLYLLVKVFHDDSNDDKKKKKDVVANYHLELFLIKNGSVKIEISKFENKEKFITKLWIFDSSCY